MTTDTDVVISGAGPVGLTLALALARRGVRTVVLERKDEHDPHSRATLLPPRALEVLAAVGVLPALLEQGRRNPALDIRRAGDRARILRFDFGAHAATTAVPFALAIPQDRTERVLLDAARRADLVEVRFGVSFARFVDGKDRITVHAGDGTTISAHHLVGADGAHSGVRDQLGWALEGTTYPTRAFLADVDVAAGADQAAGWLADPRAASFTLAVRFGDGAAGGGRWRLIESVVPDGTADTDHPAWARAITEAMFGAGSWRATHWTAAYRKHERRAHRYHLGRVVLAGDAAHLNSPAGGQGLGAGLQDAHALAWRLARLVRGHVDGTGDAERLLGSYTGERTQGFDADVRPVTDGIERMESLPARLRAIAFSAVKVLGRTPVPRLVTQRLSMLSPTPVRSILLDGPDPVGRRLPDVVLPDGRRLFELVGPDGLLLSASPGRSVPLDGITVAAPPPTLPAPFAGHHELLVRPDHLVARVAERQPLADDVVLAALGHRARRTGEPHGWAPAMHAWAPERRSRTVGPPWRRGRQRSTTIGERRWRSAGRRRRDRATAAAAAGCAARPSGRG